jgi:hypothetical protein
MHAHEIQAVVGRVPRRDPEERVQRVAVVTEVARGEGTYVAVQLQDLLGDFVDSRCFEAVLKLRHDGGPHRRCRTACSLPSECQTDHKDLPRGDRVTRSWPCRGTPSTPVA